MHCSFNNRQIDKDIELKVGDDVIPSVNHFKNLGSFNIKKTVK